MRIISREGFQVILQDRLGRFWLTRRKKYRYAPRRRNWFRLGIKAKDRSVRYIPIKQLFMIDCAKILNDKHLVIEDGKTVEAHTHLVVGAMKEAVNQALALASEKNPHVVSSEEGFYTITYIKKEDILSIKELVV